MSITRIVSGGQTGTDRGGPEAAIYCELPHGGWCPRGRKAEDGVIPPQYQLQETASADYMDRTERNVIDSDATVVFTLGACPAVHCERSSLPLPTASPDIT